MERDVAETDHIMFMLIEHCKGIEDLLDTVFEFLGRRSDFFDYGVDDDPNQHLEKCVKLVMRRCRKAGAEAMESKREMFEERKREAEEKRKLAEARIAGQGASNVIDATSCDDDEIIEVPRGQDSVETVEEPVEQVDANAPPAGNGGTTKWYVWTQTLIGVDLSVPLPPGTVSRNVKVEITPNRLAVFLKGNELFSGELHDTVKSDDCYWTLADGNTLQITLEKRNRNQWWSRVIKGHPEIDVQKIVPENSSLSDLDPETRQTVEKMMFEQSMREMGIPIDALSSQLEMLEKFRADHPEMDFSNANVNVG